VPTLAKALKERDYATYMVGKWHLGVAEESRPHNHGFDRWWGFLAGCIDYYSHIFYWGMNRPGPGVNPTHDLWQDNREVWENGRYFTELIVQRSIAFIRDAAEKKRPFLLYVGFNAPHYPMHAPKAYWDRFPGLSADRRIMAAMISAVDDGVGEIMAEIERQGLAEDTCTFFTSDNGPSRESRNWLDGTPDPYYGGTAGGLKGHKSSLFEGGIRMPAIIHWPGRFSAGRVLGEPCASMDIFPTFLNAAGADLARYEVDGRDLMPLMTGAGSLPARDLFWELRGQTAVRRSKWKLVLNGQLVEAEPPQDKMFLANLEEDMSESINLSESQPDLCRELEEAAEEWRSKIEERWEREWMSEISGTTAHPKERRRR
jgi:arylsulfatase A-like enzyme